MGGYMFLAAATAERYLSFSATILRAIAGSLANDIR
jgi:hypothetical protein